MLFTLHIMSTMFHLSGILILLFPILLNAKYDAYVTSDGSDNPSCNQTTPCGLFQIVIQNIESGNIPNDDLYIHINGSNHFMFNKSHCWVTLTGKITFIFDPNTITEANDWFGNLIDEDGFHGICSVVVTGPSNHALLTHNLLTVNKGATVAFYDLVWDHDIPFLKSDEKSSFYCERCLIQNLKGWSPFLFANEATFKDSIFRNIESSPAFELFPLAYNDFTPRTDSSLTFIGCTMLNISSAVFIDISASAGTCLQ